MGVSEGAIKLFMELRMRGLLDNMESVIEIGSQELHVSPKSFDGLLQAAGMSGYDKEVFANLANYPGYPRCSAKPFYELLGAKEYRCVDINGDHGALQLDLNLPLTDTSLYGKYDLVTDHGSNEHVFNIAEAYRTTHRLCKSGGLIVIYQECYGGNGYYNFDPSFFEGMAAANGYTILFSSFMVTFTTEPDVARAGGSPRHGVPTDEFHVPLSRELAAAIHWSKENITLGISHVFRKNSDEDFKYAYQGNLLSEAQKNAGYRLQFLPMPPSRTYLPLRGISDDDVQAEVLKSIPFKVVARNLVGRLGSHMRARLRLR